MRSAERGAALAVVLALVAGGCAGPTSEGLPGGAYVAVLNASASPSRAWSNTYCSGVLVAPDAVVTAAHCLGDGPLPDVLLGVEDLCAAPVGGERVGVADRVTGEGTSTELALLVLERPVASQVAEIEPVVESGATGVAVGWGRDDTNRRRPCRAKQIPLEVVEHGACARVVAAADAAGVAPGGWVCMTPSGSQNTCIGDSGSGVYRFEDGRLLLRGITLGGGGCGPDDPGLYADPDAVSSLLRQAGYADPTGRR